MMMSVGYVVSLLLNAEVDVNRDNLNTTTPMNKQERIKKWTAKIDKIVGNYKELSAACDVAYDAGCLDIDGKLHTAIWKSFDVLMACVEQQEWLEWYI